MKKIHGVYKNYQKREGIAENDYIFDPDDNLYNDSFEQNFLTFEPKYKPKVKNQTFQKNEKQ